jgi:hypothetical protein
VTRKYAGIVWERENNEWHYEGWRVVLENGGYFLYGHSHYGTPLDSRCRYAIVVATEEYVKKG